MQSKKSSGLFSMVKRWLQGSDQKKVEPAPESVTIKEESVRIISAPAPIAEPVKPAAPAYKEKVYRVTGMSHYMDGIMQLAEENEDYGLKKRDLVEYGMTDRRIWKYDFSPYETELVPEPDNPVDPKAIKVLINGVHVGYIKAGSCAHLLKVIRDGGIIKIEAEMCGGPYKKVSEEWNDDKEDYVYEFEKGEAPYSVVLTVTEK